MLELSANHPDEPTLPEEGRPLATDPDAPSATPGVPAFASRPTGAPVYHGFPVLDDVAVDGFRLGMISDWEAQPAMQSGDAFVVAPDNSRCGLNWYVSTEPRFSEVLAIEVDRWGVWDVGFPHQMRSREDARRNLEAILPKLKEAWNGWRAKLAAD